MWDSTSSDSDEQYARNIKNYISEPRKMITNPQDGDIYFQDKQYINQMFIKETQPIFIEFKMDSEEIYFKRNENHFIKRIGGGFPEDPVDIELIKLVNIDPGIDWEDIRGKTFPLAYYRNVVDTIEIPTKCNFKEVGAIRVNQLRKKSIYQAWISFSNVEVVKPREYKIRTNCKNLKK